MIGAKMERSTWSRSLVLAFVLATLIAASLMLLAKPAHATTFTVTTTSDFTGGGLRAAINNANNTPGADTINFNIAGTGVKTISPTSELPDITGPVTIDGYSQPGAKKNARATGRIDAVILVELSGLNAGSFTDGLNIKASKFVVRGLAINRFTAHGINILGGTGNRIEGNFLGTDTSGTLDQGNTSSGVNIEFGSTQAIVGGTTPDKRNLISGNNRNAVEIDGAGGNKVQGNLMGTQKDGTTTIGGAQNGVFSESPNNTIGGANPDTHNVIAFSIADGVEVVLSSAVSVSSNRILGNSIFSNGELGIDLGGDGRTLNDPGDVDDLSDGPNFLQNFPIIASATTSGSETTITGELDSTPNTTFTIRFFSNPQGEGEGKKLLGQQSVTTGSGGKTSFSFKSNQAVPVGQNVTATATNGGGNTSEFSDPKLVR
jgi:trimeric autotransporter adhesin